MELARRKVKVRFVPSPSFCHRRGESSRNPRGWREGAKRPTPAYLFLFWAAPSLSPTIPLSSFASKFARWWKVVQVLFVQVLTLWLPSCPVRSCSPPSPERSPPPCLPLRQHPALPRRHDTRPLSPPPPPQSQPRPSRRTSVAAAVGGSRFLPLRPKWTTVTPSDRRATGSARRSSVTTRRRTLDGGGRNGRGRWRR